MTIARKPISLRIPFVSSLGSPAIAAMGAAVFAIGSPASADTAMEEATQVAMADGTIKEIIVNARRLSANPYADPDAPYKVDRSASGKLTKPVADTPRSMTIVPKEVIEDLGAQSVRDLIRTQPGMTLGTGEGGNAFGDRIFIRGFEARNDVYIDGQRDPGVVSREIFAVEQVEILKGPSSTIGGRGTTGGAVSLVSKAPVAADFIKAEAVGGTDETMRFSLDANQRLSEKVALRVNGLFHDAEVAGRNEVWNRRWGAVAALLVEPNEAVDLKLDYYHLSTEGLPDWGIPFDSRSQQPFKGIRDNFYGLNDRDFMETRADIATAKISAEINDTLTLNSQTRWGRTRNSYIATAPERPNITNADPALWTLSANPKNRNAVTKYLANMTDVTAYFSTADIVHTLVAGVELSRETIVNRPFAFAQSETVGAPIVPTLQISQLIFNPDPDQDWPLVRALSGASTEAKVVSYAAYLIDTIELSPKFDLSIGLRYDDYNLDTTAISTAGVTTSLGNDSQFVNWNAALTWKPVDPLTLYIAASTSSNPSGEQIDGNGISYGGLGSATATLDPERNRSYEAGVKWEPEGAHLLLTGAVFRIDKTNARVNDPVTAGVQILDGRQRSQGFELGFSGNITPHWAAFGGYTYLDARVLESTNASEVGGRFPNVPKHSFSLLTTYALTDRLSIGGQAFYASTRYGGSNVAGTASLPGYWRFDATARYRVTSNVEFRLNVLNLTNKVYYDAIYRSGTPFAYVAPGRSALLTASLGF